MGARFGYLGTAVTIQVRQAGSGTILDLNGVLRNGQPVKLFADTLQQVRAAGTKNLAINLAAVPDMDSSGVGALVRAHTTARNAQGKCRFSSPSPAVAKELKIVRLDSVFEMADNEAAALAGF